MRLDPKDTLSLPRRAFCYWTDESTRTCAIVFTDNAFGYYLRCLPQIKTGDFKYQAAAVEFAADPMPALLFKPLIIKLHQDIHDEWVAKGYNVISKRPEQVLALRTIPSASGWVTTIGNGTSRYTYKEYFSNKDLLLGRDRTIDEVLWELNARANET